MLTRKRKRSTSAMSGRDHHCSVLSISEQIKHKTGCALICFLLSFSCDDFLRRHEGLTTTCVATTNLLTEGPQYVADCPSVARNCSERDVLNVIVPVICSNVILKKHSCV